MRLHLREILLLIALVKIVIGVGAESCLAADEFEIGGPLAGVPLPLMPTHFGEPLGYPGALDGVVYNATPENPRPMTTESQCPQVELYPGSVENWRSNDFKYLPVRSFFDKQSQIRNWLAPELAAGNQSKTESFAAPLFWVPRHKTPRPTGKFNAPVPVIRCGQGSPVFELDLGTLETGLYALRVIGAVEASAVKQFREPLYLAAIIDDGSGEPPTHARLRLGYCEEFYSVAEIYFHAPAARHFHAKIWIDAGSRVELLIHNISLDDALAGAHRAAIKSHPTIYPAPQKVASPKLDAAARAARDAAIWQHFPALNSQVSLLSSAGLGGDEAFNQKRVTRGAAGQNMQEIEQNFGRWEAPTDVWKPDAPLLINRKLGLSYSVKDLAENRPLPEPYPFQDDGAGLYFPSNTLPDTGQAWSPVGDEVERLEHVYPEQIHRLAQRWSETGDSDSAHDAAVALARWAYGFPAMDTANMLAAVVTGMGPYGRDWRCRNRYCVAYFLPHYMQYVDPTLYDYDRLFSYIQNNQALADSINRFVPWVHSPQDVVKLIDVYLVQTTAKRVMRYHYTTNPQDMVNIAAVVGNTKETLPWMEWAFAKTFSYPSPPAGLGDVMITANQREGTQYIGSTFYAQGEGAARMPSATERYIRAGGDRRFDLSDPRRYPKPLAHCQWLLDNVVAGADFLRIGDVAGPSAGPGFTLRELPGEESFLHFMRRGWEWSGDPQFAFVLKHYGERTQFDEASWRSLEQAAAKLSRAPWLDKTSRVMPNWAGVLETGLEHDDHRYRRAAYLRVGMGEGHHHEDTLDLQVVAHGLPATIDGGQRRGYSTPEDYISRLHNLVEVDGRGSLGHAWVQTLSDAPGARYLRAGTAVTTGARHLSRQIALIDVGPEIAPVHLPPELQRSPAKLPPVTNTPNSYVIDCVRVAGGRLHTYCFHGTVNDDFSWNALNTSAVEHLPESKSSEIATEAQYLQPFSRSPESKFAGDAPSILQATWRMARDAKTFGSVSEQSVLGPEFDPASPRFFTRLHLLNSEGLRALRADVVMFKSNYNWTNMMVRRQAADSQASLESAFLAVIEPFRGEPFVTGLRVLPIEGKDVSATRAMALEIHTRDGRTDVCQFDTHADVPRQLGDTGITAAGEYAFCSRDENGLRQMTLTGGTLLETKTGPGIRIDVAAAERSANVIAVNYAEKTVDLDRPWPMPRTPSVLEVGTLGSSPMTTYTNTWAKPQGAGSRLGLNAGADYYRSVIQQIDSQTGTVTCVLSTVLGRRPGLERGWFASDDQGKTFWRAEIVSPGVFRLSGGPAVNWEQFGPARVLSLWEIGTGDPVRQSTWTNFQRLEAGHYLLSGDVAVKMTIMRGRVEISSDGKQWRAVEMGADQATHIPFNPESELISHIRIRQ